MSDPLKLSAVEQVASIRDGNLSAEALMQATLARIGEVNGTVNAIVSMGDEEVLLADARKADGAATKGPLHGLPIAIKDLEDAKGFPTSQGSPAFAGHMPDVDSPYVTLLREAGAIIIGKTNTPEFGLGSHTYNPVHGTTANPYDTSRSCGGSSGGAAVALATGMLSIADGSDMMGSLRNPAGWNNVYGMRPSWGRVPGDAGGDMFLHRISTNGPMARTPQDLALLLDVMSGKGDHAPYAQGFAQVGRPTSDLKGKRIAWLGDWSEAWAFEEGILALCETALDTFAKEGAQVETLPAPFDRDLLWESWTTLRSWSMAASLGSVLDNPATHNQLKPEAVWEIEAGRKLSGLDVHRASEIRSDWYRTAAQLLQEYDALALPTAQIWPFPMENTWPREIAGRQMDTYHRWMEVMIPTSLAGLPAVAVPAGFGQAGLPMGLQLIGAHGNDGALLNMAMGYHEATQWPQTRPPQL
ncbi:amidase [Roseovarius rhodophyticola]|uniref:Amidase n=1 Tax=Roseovarius rhodophyticola TaxID=3080827 RepID=A0ABZ2TEY6_9RHOB|nr:amidase [Roseovarius sp. W115]MDV2928503.1 amidase [Roseovarius sp. W115]